MELIHALPKNGKMSVKVFRDNTVFVNEVFANGRNIEHRKMGSIRLLHKYTLTLKLNRHI